MAPTSLEERTWLEAQFAAYYSRQTKDTGTEQHQAGRLGDRGRGRRKGRCRFGAAEV